MLTPILYCSRPRCPVLSLAVCTISLLSPSLLASESGDPTLFIFDDNSLDFIFFSKGWRSFFASSPYLQLIIFLSAFSLSTSLVKSWNIQLSYDKEVCFLSPSFKCSVSPFSLSQRGRNIILF